MVEGDDNSDKRRRMARQSQRHVHVYFLPIELPKEEDGDNVKDAIRSGAETATATTVPVATFVVIDILRATTTMIHALSNGVGRLIPCQTVEDAYLVRQEHEQTDNSRVLLGGERHGLKIHGFDLSNSPKDYQRHIIEGCVVGFTTTNGTKALMKCSSSQSNSSGGSKPRVYIGAFCNLSALARRILNDDECDVVGDGGGEGGGGGGGPIHIVCAGSDGQVCGEDVLFAGALCERLMMLQQHQQQQSSSLIKSSTFFFEDSARIAVCQWQQETGGGFAGVDSSNLHGPAATSKEDCNDEDRCVRRVEKRLKHSLRQCKGGRGLVALGLTYEDDIDIAAKIDTHDIVGVLQQLQEHQSATTATTIRESGCTSRSSVVAI